LPTGAERAVKHHALTVALCLCLAGAAGAHASGSMRCGTKLVILSDTKLDVLDKCGEPMFREIVSGADERRVEQWIYRRSSGQFDRVLTFRGLELVNIDVRTR